MIKTLFLFGTFTGMMLGAVAARAEDCPPGFLIRDEIVKRMAEKYNEAPAITIVFDNGNTQELYFSTSREEKAWTVFNYPAGSRCGRMTSAGGEWGAFDDVVQIVEPQGEPL